jgi:hypothetical protein
MGPDFPCAPQINRSALVSHSDSKCDSSEGGAMSFGSCELTAQQPQYLS